jgi:hypothetical protein
VLHAAKGTWKRNAIRFNRLDELSRRVARLERALAGKESGDERTA